VTTVIDCSTGDPQALQELARELREDGIAFIEGPLSGSSQQIAAGHATALVGGSDAAVHDCMPVLSAIAASVVHVGPPGMGARAKLATNLVLGLNRAAFAEGLAFAEELGIAPDRFLQLVLATPARSDAAAIKGPLMVAQDFAPSSRIRQHLKDLDLMLASAHASGLDLPFTAVHAQLLREAVAAGDGDLDNAAVVRRLRGRRLPPANDPHA
jgi:3-hydroxyisobutyrate dehydrogenase-like beta-hydroxyacid dehydrogenase